MLRRIAFDEPKPPRKMNKSIAAEMETIVLKAMGKSPHERYGTAQELADDLRRFLEHRPILAKRPGLVQRVGKFVRRHEGAVTWVALASFIGLLMTSLTLGYHLFKSRRSEKRIRAELHTQIAAKQSLERTAYMARAALSERQLRARTGEGLLALSLDYLRNWPGAPTDCELISLRHPTTCTGVQSRRSAVIV